MLLKAYNEFCLAKSGVRFLILIVLDALNAQDHSLPYIYFIIILLPAKPISKPRK